MEKKKKPIQIHLPENVFDKLQNIAKKEHRTIKGQSEKIILDFINNQK